MDQLQCLSFAFLFSSGLTSEKYCREPTAGMLAWILVAASVFAVVVSCTLSSSGHLGLCVDNNNLVTVRAFRCCCVWAYVLFKLPVWYNFSVMGALVMGCLVYVHTILSYLHIDISFTAIQYIVHKYNEHTSMPCTASISPNTTEIELLQHTFCNFEK